MSISTQLTQLARNVGNLTADTNAIFEALRAKGVDVPPGATLGDVAEMIDTIETPITSVEIGGRSYPVVQIGNQLWMAENLDYKWSGLNIGINPNVQSAVYYNNDEATYGINGYKCGLLYNSNATDYLESNKSTLLPSGWRVPSLTDFTTLKNYINDASNDGYKLSRSGLDWAPNWDGSDDFGFSMMPAGQCGWDGATSSWTFISISLQGCLKILEHNYVVNRYNGLGVNNQLRLSLISNEINYQASYSLRLIRDLT